MDGFSPISYKFIAAAALTASKTLVYRMKPARSSDGNLRDKAMQPDAAGTGGISVQPGDLTGKYFATDITLSNSRGQSLTLTDAVCSVSRARTIVRTALVGMPGTIKESITEGDYELSITVGLVAVDATSGAFVDRYPADGVSALRTILDTPEALAVKSEFLALFDIDRIVVEDYKLDQMTYSNRQIVTIRAASDEDYTINYNEY